MTYRYTINGTDVNPRGDWVLQNEQGDGQIFFRRKLRGDLTFIGADYDLIMASSDCDVLEFKIFCGAAEHWEGKFKFPYDFDIDEDSCVCVGEPEVVDEYTCIMDKYETRFEAPLLVAIGGITPDIRDCAGVLLQALSISNPIGVPGGAGLSTAYLNTMINGATIYMNCGIDLRSSFLWRDDFPNGTNYAGAYGANNYITGAGNRLEFVYLCRNTLLRQDFGGTACDGIDYVSFKDIETFLRSWFNAYWYIDQNGDFRIEHIHFFDKDFPESDFETGLNLKTLISSNGKSFAHRRNKYTYETGKLYDQELWSMQHWQGTEGTIAHGSDFDAPPVFYGATEGEKSDCVPGEFKERQLATPNFWSDIFWGYQLNGAGTPDTIDCPGFCAFDIDTGTNWIRCETGAISAGNVINGHVSIGNLLEAYHTWDRIFLDGDMNGGNVVLFDSEIRKQLQEAIEFEHCCDTDFNTLDFVETELGSGKVKAATEKKRSIELELLY